MGVFALFWFVLGNLLNNSRPPPAFSPTADMAAPAPSCQAEVEAGNVMRVDIAPAKEYFADGSPLYIGKERREWILIKRRAGIPAWKVLSGAGKCRFSTPGRKLPPSLPEEQAYQYCVGHGGEWLAEMEQIGKTVGEGKAVYIGLGHCNGEPGSDCIDPLVQDALFVLEQPGRGKNEFTECMSKWPDARSEECAKTPGYWWEFSVYLDRLSFTQPEQPSYAGLPCWAKIACAGDLVIDGGNRRAAAMRYYRQTGQCPVANGQGGQEEVLGVNKQAPAPAAYAPPFPTTVAAGGHTLKLGTFNPVPRKFAYEWWTPACKPAIYLYPEQPVTLTVKVAPGGRLTKTVPEYPREGWDVRAYPNGQLRLGAQTYPYLFYEAQLKNLQVPQHGWVVAQRDLAGFFAGILPRLGLNKREQADFTAYWVRKLTDAPYYFVSLLARDALDKIEQVSFSKQPDVFIRVRFVFEKLALPLVVAPPELPTPLKRNGFVAVDWGGILLDGSCRDGVTD